MTLRPAMKWHRKGCPVWSESTLGEQNLGPLQGRASMESVAQARKAGLLSLLGWDLVMVGSFQKAFSIPHLTLRSTSSDLKDTRILQGPTQGRTLLLHTEQA
jgi:hypothetical protein